jgi:hypothetical protein
MSKSAEFQFKCTYDGPGDPMLEITGPAPEVWFNPLFYNVLDPFFARERANVEADVVAQANKYKQKFPCDPAVWAPWESVNPSAALEYVR